MELLVPVEGRGYRDGYREILQEAPFQPRSRINRVAWALRVDDRRPDSSVAGIRVTAAVDKQPCSLLQIPSFP